MKRHTYKLFTTDSIKEDPSFTYLFTDGVLDTYEWLALCKMTNSGVIYFEVEATMFKIRELKRFCKEYNAKFNTHRKVRFVRF